MLINKIKNILLIKDMSPSRFADEIGVQRPVISHILSGRNRPSLEVVQKIIRRFPELGMDWIVEEDEQPEEEETPAKAQTSPNSQTASTQGQTIEQAPLKAELSSSDQAASSRRVEKILIFYSDKTFTEYSPG